MNGERNPSVIDRALRLFADVRAGEGVNVVILALNVFILLTAYSMMKPLRSGLILVERGPEVTSYMSAAMAFVLIPVIAGYGKLADRFPKPGRLPVQLVQGTTSRPVPLSPEPPSEPLAGS